MPLEIPRRLATLALLFAGLALFLQPGGPYSLLDQVDFEREQARNPYVTSAGDDLETFIRRRTQDRRLPVSASEFDRLLGLAEAPDHPPAVLQRIDDRVVLAPASLELNLSGSLAYLQHPDSNLWLRIERLSASEIPGLAPSLRHPHRRTGTLLLVAAPLLYILLPRRKPAAGELRYGRAAAVVLPDLLGFALASLFFCGALIGLHHSTRDGWPVFIGILLLLSLFCISLPFIAAHYATLSFRLSEDALIGSSEGRKQTFAWTDMAECAPYTGHAAGRLGLLLILFARSPGMMGQGLLVAGNVERGVEIRMKDGRRLRIMANSLAGFPEIVHALETHNVPGVANLSGTAG